MTLQLAGQIKVVLDAVKSAIDELKSAINLLIKRSLSVITALQITIPKLASLSCVKVGTKVVKTIDAEAKVQADTKTQVINVETKAPAAVIKTALAAVSYLITQFLQRSQCLLRQ